MGSEAFGETKDLPQNFDVQRYDVAATMSERDWYVNLKHRQIQRILAGNPDLDPDFTKSISDHSSLIFAHPILRYSEATASSLPRPYGGPQVRDISTLDYLLAGPWLMQSENDNRSKYKEAARIVDEWFSAGKEDIPGFREAYDLMETPAREMLAELGVNTNGETTVVVNLYASEDKLIADFRAWLHSARKAFDIPGPRHRFGTQDLSRWQSNKVLAYLDLTLWATIRGVKFTNQLLGVALFPDEYNIGLSDRIRKVVAPLAQSAISDTSLDAFYTQLESDADEKSRESLPE